MVNWQIMQRFGESQNNFRCMIKAISKKNGICGGAFMSCSHILAGGEWEWEDSVLHPSGLYMGRIHRRDSVKPTEGKDFCS